MVDRVLFVDDDSRVLKGIKRMLWHTDYDWEAAYAAGASEALDLLQVRPFDVIVSDMRMPDEDGASLLSRVRELYPAMVRIILSGYSEEDSILRTVGQAHQFLAKPCGAEALIETIQRSLELRLVLRDENLRKVIGGMTSLPSPSDVYMRFLNELQNEAASYGDIARIIAGDVALTAETLKLTNSAFFGLPQDVKTLETAVAQLGMDTLRALVLGAGFYGRYQGQPEVAERIKRLSNRSLVLGLAARQLAKLLGLTGHMVDLAGYAGVLSHVGTLALLSNAPDLYENVTEVIENEGATVIAAERAVLGTTHQEIGAYLLGLRGFCDPIVEAVAYHHEPGKSMDHTIGPLTALHLAQEFVKPHTEDVLESDGVWAAGIDQQYLLDVGVSQPLTDLLQDYNNNRNWGDEDTLP